MTPLVPTWPHLSQHDPDLSQHDPTCPNMTLTCPNMRPLVPTWPWLVPTWPRSKSCWDMIKITIRNKAKSCHTPNHNKEQGKTGRQHDPDMIKITIRNGPKSCHTQTWLWPVPTWPHLSQHDPDLSQHDPACVSLHKLMQAYASRQVHLWQLVNTCKTS